MAQPDPAKGKKLIWMVSGCLLVAAFGVLGIRWLMPQASGSSKAPAADQARENTVRAAATYKVGKVDIPQTILLTGDLKAALSRDILAPHVRSMFGSMITFLAPEGSTVKQGQRILEFDSSSLASQRVEAQRQLDERKLQIEKTKVDLENQRNDLMSTLSDAEGALKDAELFAGIPKEIQAANDYQKYQLNKEKALLARDKAKERLTNLDATAPAQIQLVEIDKAQAEVNLKKIDNDIAALQIDAPQDGIIIYGDNWSSNRKVQVGDTLGPGQTVLTIPDLSTMQVVGNVFDTELKYLSPGMICTMSLDALPGKTFRGKIVSLASVAGRKSFVSQQKVFKVIIQPDKVEEDAWKPGMTVRIEVPVSLASGVIGVPREYLGLDGMGRYYVLKGDKPETAVTQLVKVGDFGDRLVQITSGLKEGDQILTIGAAAEVKS